MNKQIRLSLTTLALGMLGGMLATAAHAAVACGDTVSGAVVLTQDLNCSGAGLQVGASDTIIDLNGFTISCTGNGFGGSCQPFSNAQNPSGPSGIYSWNHDRVTIKGPGTITGFFYGINLQGGGRYYTVKNVTVTAPPNPPAAANNRGTSIGIAVYNAKCDPTPSPFPPLHSFSVSGNQVYHHNIGITAAFATCGLINNNIVAHNASGMWWDRGIDIADASNNTVAYNTVTQNGRGVQGNSGIYIHQNAAGNNVYSNYVSNNCGDGIGTGDAVNNAISQNTVKQNGKAGMSTDGTGQCYYLPLSPFKDLTAANTNNLFTNSNVCNTQNANVQAGVCEPNE